MPITSHTILDEGVSGQSTGTDAGTATRKYNVAFLVEGTADTMPDNVISYFQQHADLPYHGRRFGGIGGNSFDNSAVCRELNITRISKSEGKYVVTARYEPDIIELPPWPSGKVDINGKEQADPTLWAHEIDISKTQVSIPLESAVFRGFKPPGINNKFLKPNTLIPVVNSALVPYDPPPEWEVDITVLRITKYIKFAFPHEVERFHGAVNSDTVLIVKPAYSFVYRIQPLTARIKNLAFTFQIINGFPVFRHSIELHINPLGWRYNVVDKGLDPRAAPGDPDGAGGTISEGATFVVGDPRNRRLTDKLGNPLVEPVLFDGNGQALAPEKQNNPVYLIYSAYKEIPFLGIQW